jgi:hypothetical protein
MPHCTTSLTDSGSNPGAGTVNQIVQQPSGGSADGKLVAILIYTGYPLLKVAKV